MYYHVLYNPYAGNGHGEEISKELNEKLKEHSLTFQDMTQITDYETYFNNIPRENNIIICGGDGTLNRFINEAVKYLDGYHIYYYAAGSGNDFLHDIAENQEKMPICIDQYIKNLPQVTVNGNDYLFLNGIGYGIDGYCCEVGDELRKTSTKPINYTSIAIKGLLFHYKPTNATITVDGKTYKFNKVWLAPAMNGRFYGGGMMPTPEQERLNTDKTLSVMVMYGSGKLKTLSIFPSIFKGEHIKHSDCVKVLSGHNITVEFDRPTALQIDGETILGVTQYQACAYQQSHVSVK
ncbi:MAG: diacylglycerol/lipid kinase family protein [Acutalibacteraceae bacterium]